MAVFCAFPWTRLSLTAKNHNLCCYADPQSLAPFGPLSTDRPEAV